MCSSDLKLRGLMAAEALSAALFPSLGKAEAQKLVRDLSARVVKEKTHLKKLAAADARIQKSLNAAALDAIFAHRDALKAAEAETRRLLQTLT